MLILCLPSLIFTIILIITFESYQLGHYHYNSLDQINKMSKREAEQAIEEEEEDTEEWVGP